MIETSAHLIDHVIPHVPLRQWVLSFPWPLRMLFASRPQALSRCLAVITRAIQTDLAQRAGLKPPMAHGPASPSSSSASAAR